MAETTLDAGQADYPEPAAAASPWGAILTVGGLVGVAATIGFGTVQMRFYEERIEQLESLVTFGPDAAVAASPAEPDGQARVDAAGPEVAETPLADPLLPEPAPANPGDAELTAARERIAALEDENTKLALALDDARQRLENAAATGQVPAGDKCVDELRSRDALIARLTRENRTLAETCQAAKL